MRADGRSLGRIIDWRIKFNSARPDGSGYFISTTAPETGCDTALRTLTQVTLPAAGGCRQDVLSEVVRYTQGIES
jgi:hypothetical protein